MWYIYPFSNFCLRTHLGSWVQHHEATLIHQLPDNTSSSRCTHLWITYILPFYLIRTSHCFVKFSGSVKVTIDMLLTDLQQDVYNSSRYTQFIVLTWAISSLTSQLFGMSLTSVCIGYGGLRVWLSSIGSNTGNLDSFPHFIQHFLDKLIDESSRVIWESSSSVTPSACPDSASIINYMSWDPRIWRSRSIPVVDIRVHGERDRQSYGLENRNERNEGG